MSPEFENADVEAAIDVEFEEGQPTPANPLLSLGAPDLQSLLAAQMGGQLGSQLGGQLGSGDLMSLLAGQSGAASDQFAMAMRWLEQRKAMAPAPVEHEPSDAELELERLEELQRRRARDDARRERSRELKALVTSLYAELETLRGRNDAVAAALGACYLCFGEDPACPECGGRGHPGSLTPEPAAFRRYVVPAVRRARAAQNRPLGHAPPPTGREPPNGRDRPPSANGRASHDPSA